MHVLQNADLGTSFDEEERCLFYSSQIGTGKGIRITDAAGDYDVIKAPFRFRKQFVRDGERRFIAVRAGQPVISRRKRKGDPAIVGKQSGFCPYGLGQKDGGKNEQAGK